MTPTGVDALTRWTLLLTGTCTTFHPADGHLHNFPADLEPDKGSRRDSGAVERRGGLFQGHDVDEEKGVVPTTRLLPAALILEVSVIALCHAINLDPINTLKDFILIKLTY